MTTPPLENRGLPDGSGGEAAAAQPTRGLGVSTAETRLLGFGRKSFSMIQVIKKGFLHKWEMSFIKKGRNYSTV